MFKYALKVLFFYVLFIGFVFAAKIGDNLYVQIKPDRVTKEDLDSIKRLGFAGVRFGISWSDVERKKNSYNFSQSLRRTALSAAEISYDVLLEELHTRGLRTLITLSRGNPIYSGGYKDFWIDQRRASLRGLAAPSSSDQIEAFAKFAAETVEHYSVKKQYSNINWLIWNEPNIQSHFLPSPKPELYLQLALKTCINIRNVFPAANVSVGALAPAPGKGALLDYEFIKTLIESDLLYCATNFAIHPYRFDRPENSLLDYTWLKSQLPVSKKIAVDEVGYSGFIGRDVSLRETKRAAFLLRAYLASLSAEIAYFNIYEWDDSGVDLKEREHNFGFLTANKAAKPAYDLFKMFLDKYSGFSFGYVESSAGSLNGLLSNGVDRYSINISDEIPTDGPMDDFSTFGITIEKMEQSQ